jgi:hypothetical protein
MLDPALMDQAIDETGAPNTIPAPPPSEEERLAWAKVLGHLIRLGHAPSIERVQAVLDSGATMEEAAGQLGVSKVVLYRWIHDQPLIRFAVRKRGVKGTLTQEQIIEAWHLRARGWGHQKIGAHLGHNWWVIEHALTRWTQPPRSDLPPLPGPRYHRWLMAEHNRKRLSENSPSHSSETTQESQL